MKLFLGVVQLGLLSIPTHLSYDNLLDEFVLLTELVTLEVDLALHGILLAAHTLQILFDVLNGNVVMAFEGLLFGYSPKLINLGLCSKSIGLPPPLIHLRANLQHFLLLLAQSEFQFVIFNDLQFQCFVKAGGILGVHTRRTGTSHMFIPELFHFILQPHDLHFVVFDYLGVFLRELLALTLHLSVEINCLENLFLSFQLRNVSILLSAELVRGFQLFSNCHNLFV